MRPSPTHKEIAFRNQQKAQVVAADSYFAAVVVSRLPKLGPFIAIAPAALGYLYSRRAIGQSKIVHDPPRDDFERSTSLSPTRLNLEALAESPVTVPTMLMRTTDDATRALSAMLRSVERAWGAQIVEETNAALEHETEAFRFASMAGGFLVESSSGASEFSVWFSKYHQITDEADQGTNEALGQVLPNQTLAFLYKMGIPHSYIRQKPRPYPAPDDPVGNFISTVRATAIADEEYGLFLIGDEAGLFTERTRPLE
jgi:hypothetical protein